MPKGYWIGRIDVQFAKVEGDEDVGDGQRTADVSRARVVERLEDQPPHVLRDPLELRYLARIHRPRV